MLNWLAQTWGVTPLHPAENETLKAQALANIPVEDPLNTKLQQVAQTKILTLVNNHRVNCRLKPLDIHVGLNVLAESHSVEMQHRNSLTHARWDTLRYPAIKNFGFNNAGENVGHCECYKSEFFEGLDRFVPSWLASPEHRQVIETGCFEYTGIGLYVSGEADSDRIQLWATQIFAS